MKSQRLLSFLASRNVEFAPEAELIAAKALWKSLGLAKRPDRGWPGRAWAACGNLWRLAAGAELAAGLKTGGAERNAESGNFVIPVAYRSSRQGRISVLNRGHRGRGFQLCDWCGFGRMAPEGGGRRGRRRS